MHYLQEVERKAMHQKLETETIKASILRHDLKMLPGIIRDEIMGNISSAPSIFIPISFLSR